MKWKLIIFLFLIILIPLIIAENNTTETISNSAINQSINRGINESREGFVEENNSLEFPELPSAALLEQNQSENLTKINQTENPSTNNTNITILPTNLSQNITEIGNINNTNVTEINQTNSLIISQIFNIIINYIAEGATHVLNLFTFGSQGKLTSGAIYEARFLLTGYQTGNPNAQGLTYQANIGFFKAPEEVGEPILISNFISPSNGKIVTQGDTSVSFVVKLENTGGSDAANITFFMEIPSEWTIISGAGNNANGIVILDSGFNLSVGQTIQKVLEVSIPEDATTGNFTLKVNSTGHNATTLALMPAYMLIGDSVVVKVTSQYPAPIPTPGPPPTGGGGGAPAITCIQNWICTEWTACTNGIQTRICKDANDCATTFGKPLESKNCSIKDALFDLNINIIKRELKIGEPVLVTIELLNFGTSGAFNVLLVYDVIDSKGNIIYTEDETQSINIQKQFTKTFEIPESEGEHILRVTLTHANQKEPIIAEDRFIIIVPKKVFAPFAIFEAERIRSFFSGLRLVFVLGFILIILILFVLRRHYNYMKDRLRIVKNKRKLHKKVKLLEKDQKLNNRIAVFKKK